MAKGGKGRHRVSSRQYRACPYPLRFNHGTDIMEDFPPKQCPKTLERKDWEDVTCSVCMEYPHNAVLLLCSSHDKGCRPYMCGTSCRHSNCLDQYKKAYTKLAPPPPIRGGSATDPIVIPDSGMSPDGAEVAELACPLCRGQVKGWTVVEPAREYLNAKSRSCTHDKCSFVGSYRELRKHVKALHPSQRAREVDPAVEQKWTRLESERERNDVISTITSTMPGAMFFGDYVIEGNHNHNNNYAEEDSDEEGDNGGNVELGFNSNLVNVFLLLHAFGSSGGNELSRRLPQMGTPGGDVALLSDQDEDEETDEEDDDDGNGGGDMSLASRLHRHGRVLLGRSGRRRRQRDLNGSPR